MRIATIPELDLAIAAISDELELITDLRFCGIPRPFDVGAIRSRCLRLLGILRRLRRRRDALAQSGVCRDQLADA